MKNCFSKEGLEIARAEGRRYLDQSLQYPHTDTVTFVNPNNTILGRRLDKYREILSHNGAPDIVDFLSSRPNAVVVDGGSGAASALCDLRPLFPNARLIGIDVRNVAQNRLEGSDRRVGEVLHERNVEFYQDAFLEIQKYAKDGYDLYLSVGAFFNYRRPQIPHAPVLKHLYDGLVPGGITLIQYNPSAEMWAQAKECLDSIGLPHKLIPSDKGILNKHALGHNEAILGTLVLGPKTAEASQTPTTS